MSPSFVVESLSQHHGRAAFACGNAALDDFIRTKARKEHELGFSAVFVAVSEAKSETILGYYSLSSHSIAVQGIPPEVRRRFPRYPAVPTTLLGRLARSLQCHGQRVGEFLLLDALSRALQSSDHVGSYAVVVDAIDGAAISFYSKYGFLPTEEHPNRLYLPIASIKRLGL
jgi:predicted GNAT family N-acyltransferase